MAIQVYADGSLVYDSRLPDHTLLGLRITTGLNKGGTAELVMPPNHPGYNKFTSYKTVVEIRRDGALLFRGRALYPMDDFYKRRTIVCEGERCFLRDGVMRPYLYQDDPAIIFADAVALYNAQVEPFKQFVVGEVTVTDANDYVRLESGEAESFLAFFDKMIERCGGYITFNYDDTGKRVINWLEEIGTQSNQVIQFGSNLLDLSRIGASLDLATVVVPYGTQLEDGTRVDITSVTDGGVDYIQDAEAVALRGTIVATVTWDDVTTPANLLRKAQQWLASHKLAITTLTLTAADLSRLDSSVDFFRVGDRVRVVSKPHGLDDYFQLQERTEDLLDPAGGSITLGKDRASLTGADVAGDRESASALQRVKREVVADYQTNIAKAVQEATLTLSSLIQQTSDSIMTQVAETYATNGDVTALVSSQITQLSDSVTFTFRQLQTELESIDDETRTKFTELEKYVRIENGDIVLGEQGNDIVLRLENDRISFYDSGAEVAHITKKQLYITDAHFLNSLRIGRFQLIPRENGNLSMVKVG